MSNWIQDAVKEIYEFDKITPLEMINIIKKHAPDVDVLKAENEKLKSFVEHCLNDYAWDNYNEPDGIDIQDKAEELGFIEKRPCTEEQSIDGEKEHYFIVWSPWTDYQKKHKGDNHGT